MEKRLPDNINKKKRIRFSVILYRTVTQPSVIGVFGIILLIGIILWVPLDIFNKTNKDNNHIQQREQTESLPSCIEPKTSFSFSAAKTHGNSENQNANTSSSSEYLKKGDTFSVSLEINSEKEVFAADLIIDFDPKALSFDSLESGTFFNAPIELYKKIDKDKGRIMYSISALQPAREKGTLATLNFTAQSQTLDGFISIGDKTLIATNGGNSLCLDLPEKKVFIIE